MSGFLDTEELTAVLHKYYRQNEGMSRPKVKVNREVKEAMETHDVDRSGTLEVNLAFGLSLVPILVYSSLSLFHSSGNSFRCFALARVSNSNVRTKSRKPSWHSREKPKPMKR